MTANSSRPGCLSPLLRILGIQPQSVDAPAEGPLPYRTRDDFLSPAELSFFRVLSLATGQRAVICPKVGLADIFFVARPNENHVYYNQIRQKHVDFLVCDPATMRPLAGVELDDASHRRADRRERDEFVERAFAAAGLPLLRFPARPDCSLNEINEQVAPLFVPERVEARTDARMGIAGDAGGEGHYGAAGNSQDQAGAGTAASSNPICPKCGVPMIVRTAARGNHAGQRFYGCPNYPRCRETMPIP